MCCFTLSADNKKHVTQEINIIFLVPEKNSDSFLLCLESVPMAVFVGGKLLAVFVGGEHTVQKFSFHAIAAKITVLKIAGLLTLTKVCTCCFSQQSYASLVV